jgi:hypothetical protein
MAWHAQRVRRETVKHGIDKPPFRFETLFPPGKKGPGDVFLTAHWLGTFVLPNGVPSDLRSGPTTTRSNCDRDAG